MPRGKTLTDYEKGQIEAKKAQGLSNRQIARELHRSEGVIRCYVRNPVAYGTTSHPGRPSSLSDRQKRLILREASNQVTTCSRIKADLKLDVSAETVRRVISKAPFIKWRKMKKAPLLTAKHRKNRLEFAGRTREPTGKRLDFLTQLSSFFFHCQVVFSDEKKFSCDGPDGFRSYWHDLRKAKLRFSRRNFKGGGVMVWAAISSKGRIKLCFVSKKMNGSDYRIVLRRGIVPFWRRNRNQNYIFQQDGAPIHRARATRDWLQRRRIDLLQWPACSPDLNIMENVWGCMVRDIYGGNRTYRNVDELKPAIVAAWHRIDQKLIDNLYLSLDRRMFQLIQRHGAATDY